jgi:hypothetical protein
MSDSGRPEAGSWKLIVYANTLQYIETCTGQEGNAANVTGRNGRPWKEPLRYHSPHLPTQWPCAERSNKGTPRAASSALICLDAAG